MNRGQARVVAIVVVVAMIVALAAAALSSGGDDVPDPTAASGVDASDQDGGDGVLPPTGSTPVGPHLQVTLCDGSACPAVTDEQVAAIETALTGDPRVARAQFVSSQQAYELFLEEFGDDEELAQAVGPDAIPPYFAVDVLLLDGLTGVQEDARGLDGVDQVVDLVATRP